jgi:hypothetical protein
MLEHRGLVTALEAIAAQVSDHSTRLCDLLARKVSDENRQPKIGRFSGVQLGFFEDWGDAVSKR